MPSPPARQRLEAGRGRGIHRPYSKSLPRAAAAGSPAPTRPRDRPFRPIPLCYPLDGPYVGSDMEGTAWTIRAMEFSNCNCAYGCPCQFNGLPTHGYCQAVGGFEIEQGHHGSTRLDGLKFVGIFRWPGAIPEGKGEAAVVIDERA